MDCVRKVRLRTQSRAFSTTQARCARSSAYARLDASQISDVIAIDSADTFQHPIYAGDAIATVQSADAVNFATIRTTAFNATRAEGGKAEIETAVAIADSGLSAFVRREVATNDRPELTAARVIVSGGRGLGSKENFALLDPLAEKLGAAVGASRAAVDSGYAPNDWRVGQTRKIVAPELYVAVGISGAIQHLAGMKESKVIVAVNKDADAPIFSVADYGLGGDFFEVVPSLTQSFVNTESSNTSAAPHLRGSLIIPCRLC